MQGAVEARGCQRIALYTAFEETPDETVRTAFRELVRRRAEGTPVAYLVGRREFFSLSFRVNSDVLIPRPETEDTSSIETLEMMSSAPGTKRKPESLVASGFQALPLDPTLALGNPSHREEDEK